jgi:hypothetical protein
VRETVQIQLRLAHALLLLPLGCTVQCVELVAPPGTTRPFASQSRYGRPLTTTHNTAPHATLKPTHQERTFCFRAAVLELLQKTTNAIVLSTDVDSVKHSLTRSVKSQPAEFISSSPLFPHSTMRRIPNESCFASPIHKRVLPTNCLGSPLDIPLQPPNGKNSPKVSNTSKFLHKFWILTCQRDCHNAPLRTY